MIKEIEQTGLKYLCKRKQFKDPTDHIRYKGSGVLWRRILNAHPEYTLNTIVLGLYDKEDLEKYGRYYSELYNVVESKEWANLKIESGDGGETHKGTHPYIDPLTNNVVYRKSCPNGYLPFFPKREKKKRIHNIVTKEVKNVPIDDPIPDGWARGGLKGKYSYGPRKDKTQVYHNGSHKIYLEKGSPIPPGYSRGVHYEGTTKDRAVYYDPTTKKKVYLKEDQTPPIGYIKGQPPTTGKRIQTPYGIFDSVQACMNQILISRLKINHNIKKLPNEWKYLND